MASRKPAANKAVKQKKRPVAKAEEPKKAETITCPHCRYERPARDAHCHICGYPFPWMDE